MFGLKNPLDCSKAHAAGTHASALSGSTADLPCAALSAAGSADRAQAAYCVVCLSLSLHLQPGTYCYQYLVDGTWMTSPDAPVGPDDDGHLCNRVSACHAPSPHAPACTCMPRHWQTAWDPRPKAARATAQNRPWWLEQLRSAGCMASSCLQPAAGLPCCLGLQLGMLLIVASGWRADNSGSPPSLSDLLRHRLGGACAARAGAERCRRASDAGTPSDLQPVQEASWHAVLVYGLCLRAQLTCHAGVCHPCAMPASPHADQYLRRMLRTFHCLQGWRDVPMQRTPSRASPSGGRWRTATIPATGDPAQGPPQLEFTVINASSPGSSGNGKDVDAPTHAASYRLRCPGGFRLQHGRLHPFPRACAAASMLVCIHGMLNASAHQSTPAKLLDHASCQHRPFSVI